MNIEDVDPNFKAVKVGEKDVVFHNVLLKPFSFEGSPWGDKSKGEFYRLPADMEAPKDVNEGALWNGHQLTSGICVRFETDATFIAIKAVLHDSCDMNHMPRAGSAGFDLYVGPSKNSHHVGTAQPCRDEINLERTLLDRPLWKNEMREFRINFPLYGGVTSLEVGLPVGSKINAPFPHAIKPILFYGSSITQGGCASRPGNNYCSMVSRAMDAEQINLGFSGCGRGEIAVAKAIASLDLSLFVMDYDYNAPTIEALLATHEPFYKEIRSKHPNLPIIMMTKCNPWDDGTVEEDAKRFEIIKATYDKAIASGDKHLYFIDGHTLFGNHNRTDCTVDGCHPNDLGFFRMYEAVLPVAQKAILEAQQE